MICFIDTDTLVPGELEDELKDEEENDGCEDESVPS